MKQRSIVEVNEGAVELSKCGRFIACGCENTVQVIDSNSAEVISTFPCSNLIKALDWHFSSNHVLSVLDKVSTVQAFSLTDPEWICRIEGGELGLVTAKWGPRGYFILTLAEFGVRISVWSLTGQSLCYIDNPILKKRDEFSFSTDGKYFAVLIGPLESYNIVIYCTETWSKIQEVECTGNVVVPSNPLWSPTNLHFVIWEMVDWNCAFLEVYSPARSQPSGIFRRRSKFCRISKLSWVPTGQFLLVGCHDERIYVLNYVTWSVLAVLNHSPVITDGKCEVYAEEWKTEGFELVDRRPVTVSKVNSSVKAGLMPGLKRIACDGSSRYVATQCESMPAILFIWEIGSFRLRTVLAFHGTIVDAKWNPTESKLMICSNSRRVSTWSSSGLGHVTYSSTERGIAFVRSCFWCRGDGDFAVVGSSFLYILYGNG